MLVPYSFEPMISDSESLPDGDFNDDEERLLDLSWYGKAKFVLYRLFFLFSFNVLYSGVNVSTVQSCQQV